MADHDIECVLPATVWREDGPYGPGACQVWIDVDATEVVNIVRPAMVPEGWRTVLRAQTRMTSARNISTGQSMEGSRQSGT